jgi:hypothetical protein
MTSGRAQPTHANSKVGAGPLFWLSAAAGWAVMAYGLWGVFHHHLDTQPENLATFAVAGALLNDLLLAPFLLLVGVAITRVVPARARAIVQTALIVSGSLILFAYPLVRRYADALHNPSSLPHDYTTNLSIVLASVWVIAALAIAVKAGVGKRGGPVSQQPDQPASNSSSRS